MEIHSFIIKMYIYNIKISLKELIFINNFNETNNIYYT
jgi:hypothetical protein